MQSQNFIDLKEPIEQGLHCLEKASVIEKVPFSEWAALILPVPKADGKVRICGDYSHCKPSPRCGLSPITKTAGITGNLSWRQVYVVRFILCIVTVGVGSRVMIT